MRTALSLTVCSIAACFSLAGQILPALAADAPARTLTGAEIQDGLTVTVKQTGLDVAGGHVWIDDKLVAIAPKSFSVPGQVFKRVADEKVTLSDSLVGSKTNILSACLAGGGQAVPQAVIPASVHVKPAPGTSAKQKYYTFGTDFTLDLKTGELKRLPGGKIADGATVYVDYMLLTKRIDLLEISPSGELRIETGIPDQFAPSPPPCDAGSTALANVIIGPLGITDFLPIRDLRRPFMDTAKLTHYREAIAKTLEKLRTGRPVTIVVWGDSITVGCSANPGHEYVHLLENRLRASYPGCKLSFISAGIGATNTSFRLPKFNKEVLSHKPDLVIVEFVNDLIVDPDQLFTNYSEIVEKCSDAGIEMAFVEPHLPSPKIYRLADYKAVASMPAFGLIDKFAQRYPIAIADVKERWLHLPDAGLNGDLLLADGTVHPNDVGHELYADELMRLLEPKQPNTIAGVR